MKIAVIQLEKPMRFPVTPSTMHQQAGMPPSRLTHEAGYSIELTGTMYRIELDGHVRYIHASRVEWSQELPAPDLSVVAKRGPVRPKKVSRETVPAATTGAMFNGEPVPDVLP